MHVSSRGQCHCLTLVKGHSDLFSNICCKITGSTEAEFYVELLCVGRMKGCSNGHGHVTKMSTILIQGIKPLKIFSETNRLMTFEFDIQH